MNELEHDSSTNDFRTITILERMLEKVEGIEHTVDGDKADTAAIMQLE